MSRSIHSTHSDYRREQEKRHGESRLDEIKKQISKKRRIKRQMRRQRQDEDTKDLPLVQPGSIPVDVVDQGPWIHYPASAQDVYEVMERLPTGVLNGLSRVQLCLGKKFQEEYLAKTDRSSTDHDPWLGRIGTEEVPGVFIGELLGMYWTSPARIFLYAFVYDPAMPNREMWELFLRLRMLSTLVHEVAHHEDNMQRVARGRWRMDDSEKAEEFAETMAATWTRQYVVPYLQEAYPNEVREFNTWVEHHGGVKLPLELLAGYWRWNEDGQVVLVYSGSALESFQALVSDVNEESDLMQDRLAFARALDYGENYNESLAIIARVLSEQPEHLQAIVLKADIYVHLEKDEEAERLAISVIEQDESFTDAWEVLSDIYEFRQEWSQLRTAVTCWFESDNRNSDGEVCTSFWTNPRMLFFRIRANLELQEYGPLEEDLSALTKFGGRSVRHARAFRSLMALRQENFAEALRLADWTADPQPDSMWIDTVIFLGVRCEASFRLNGVADVMPDEEMLDFLRMYQFDDWVDRLVSIGASP